MLIAPLARPFQLALAYAHTVLSLKYKISESTIYVFIGEAVKFGINGSFVRRKTATCSITSACSRPASSGTLCRRNEPSFSYHDGDVWFRLRARYDTTVSLLQSPSPSQQPLCAAYGAVSCPARRRTARPADEGEAHLACNTSSSSVTSAKYP